MEGSRAPQGRPTVGVHAEGEPTGRMQHVTRGTSASAVWIRDIVEYIAAFLPPNDIACTMRLVSRDAAALFRHRAVVKLSQPSPHDVFRRRWGSRSAFDAYTWKDRLRFLSLTAASGSLPNLKIAVEAAGCSFDSDSLRDGGRWRPMTGQLMEAAAAAGHHHICRWLHARGCPLGNALASSAEAGHQEICCWLLGLDSSRTSTSVSGYLAAAAAAARGGHVGLMDSLLDHCLGLRSDFHLFTFLPCVAYGCDLATLKRVHGRMRGVVPDQPYRLQQLELELLHQHQQQPDSELRFSGMLAAAAHSPTPDWRAKLEWLESQGYSPSINVVALAACGDAAGRLTWLRHNGYRVATSVFLLSDIASTGNLDLLRAVLADQQPGDDPLHSLPAEKAARGGHLAVLRELQSRGWPLHPSRTILAAAEGGHLEVVAWVAAALRVDVALLGPGVRHAAARSGRVELLEWLRERGCSRLDADSFAAAAGSGCVAGMRWLAERGCPMPDGGKPFVEAARNGDLATLRCLHRLGCPLEAGAPSRPSAATLNKWLRSEYPLPVLRWLVEEAGCRVDWRTAVRAALEPTWILAGPRQRGVVAWLRAERRRQRRDQLAASREVREAFPRAGQGAAPDVAAASAAAFIAVSGVPCSEGRVAEAGFAARVGAVAGAAAEGVLEALREVRLLVAMGTALPTLPLAILICGLLVMLALLPPPLLLAVVLVLTLLVA